MPRPVLFFCEEERTVNMPVTCEIDECLLKTKAACPVHAKIQRMIQTIFHVLQQITLDYCIEAVTETKVVGLLETANL